MGQPGADCSVVAGKQGNACGAKGAGHRYRGVRVNGKPEELDGLDGRRQPLVGGTSRISREAYVRICERLGVKFPGATRRWETGRRFRRQRSRPASTLPPEGAPRSKVTAWSS